MAAPAPDRATGSSRASPDVVLLERPLDGLRPDRAVRPELDFAHRADRARFHPFADLTRPFPRVALIPHLGHELGVSAGVLRQHTHLPHGPRQRLLDVRMLARFHGTQSGRGMRVIGRGNRDRVDALRFLVEHLPVVPVALRLRVALKGVFGGLPVDVAQRVDVLALHALHVVAAHAAHANAGDVELVARRAVAAPQGVARHYGESRSRRDAAHELASRYRRHDPCPGARPAPGAIAGGRNSTAKKIRTTAANPAGSTQKLGQRSSVSPAAAPRSQLYTLPATWAPMSMPMP